MTRALLIALLASTAFCQTADNSPAFGSADVHVSPPATNQTPRVGVPRGGRYEIHTATMTDLIGVAYNMESDKVLGGPNWLDWDRFDMIATVPPATTRENLNLMLQKQLALKLGMGERPLPVPVVDHVEDKPTEN
jgi:hypothetical protein